MSHESMSTSSRNSQVFHDVRVGALFLETCDEASRSSRGCDGDERFFGNVDRSSSWKLSSEPSHDTQPFFFTKSPWEEETLLRKLQQWILRRVERSSKRENSPIFVSIDDTICQKTKPSSRATRTIQGCDWHYSHANKNWHRSKPNKPEKENGASERKAKRTSKPDSLSFLRKKQ